MDRLADQSVAIGKGLHKTASSRLQSLHLRLKLQPLVCRHSYQHAIQAIPETKLAVLFTLYGYEGRSRVKFVKLASPGGVRKGRQHDEQKDLVAKQYNFP